MNEKYIQAALAIWKALEAAGVTDKVAQEIKELFSKEVGIDVSDLEKKVQELAEELKNPDQFFEGEKIPSFKPEPSPVEDTEKFPYNEKVSMEKISEMQHLLKPGDMLYFNLDDRMYFVLARGVGSPVPEGYTLLKTWV